MKKGNKMNIEIITSQSNNQYTLGTTDTKLVNDFCKDLMSKIPYDMGLSVERFIGCDETIIEITKEVRHGIVMEWNTHELQGVMPLEPRPVFFQTFDN